MFIVLLCELCEFFMISVVYLLICKSPVHNLNWDSSMNKQERIDLANWTMNYALKQGADQAAVSISKSRNIAIEHRNNRLEKIQDSTQNSLKINIYARNRYSGHSTSDLKKSS